MKFELDPLPYRENELAPHIGAETVDLHYHKHHAGYLRKLADEIRGRPIADRPLDEIVKAEKPESSIFRNAAQVWNHTFYWNSLAPKGGGRPSGKLADQLKRDFGDIDNFKQRYAEAAKGEFGSGWAWLVADQAGRLSVLSTTDANNPMREDYRPLLALDVWEHAYYLDYKNERGRYVEACLDHLLNWQFAESNYEMAAIADLALFESVSDKAKEGTAA
jgi:Fe-Mn family superoxide dismutase